MSVTDSQPNPPPEPTDREQLLSYLQDVIEESRRKSVGDGRIRDYERDRTRIKYMRLCVSAIDSYEKIIRQQEIEELEARLETIESVVE